MAVGIRVRLRPLVDPGEYRQALALALGPGPADFRPDIVGVTDGERDIGCSVLAL